MGERQPATDNLLNQIETVQQGINHLAAAADAGVLAGLVAHEVRNLLTPAVAYAQLALHDPTASRESQRQALDRSLLAMRRACEVSELILAQVREASPTPLARLDEVVGDCVRSLGWDKRRHSFSLGVDVPACTVRIPAEALRHVILNLLLNARSALPAEGGRIDIGATWNQDDVAITIADNGRGIEPIKLQRIRAGLARHSQAVNQRHAGLGLLLCDRLLAASGARLTIDSQEGSGTTATVAVRAAA